MIKYQGKAQEKKENDKYSKHFTRVPNIIFYGYPDLSKEEKYLTCFLRCIYWDAKPRYVSLRELHMATGYSVGALSKMLPRLNDSGLIHAEIRREIKHGKEEGNPKYYITIPDIWERNLQFFSCSPNEQGIPGAQGTPESSSRNEQDRVHEMNRMHTCSPNDTGVAQSLEKTCSPNDGTCSPNATNLFTKRDELVSCDELDCAHIEHAKDITKDITKDLFKDKESSSSRFLQPDHLHQPNGDAHKSNFSFAYYDLIALDEFIALDDKQSPKVMTILLTPKQAKNAVEDSRRSFLAQEVQEELAQRGYDVTCQWQREPDQQQEDISSIEAVSPSLQGETDNLSESKLSSLPEKMRTPSQEMQPSETDATPSQNSSIPTFNAGEAVENRKDNVIPLSLFPQTDAPLNEKKRTSKKVIAQEENLASSQVKKRGESASANKAEPPPKATREQLKKAYQVISETKAKIYNDPVYVEVPSDRSTKALSKLIEAKGTPQMLALVIKDMWNDPGTDGMYWWRKNRRNMSVTAICGQYSDRASAIRARVRMVPANPDVNLTSGQTTPPPISVRSTLGDQSIRPELQPWKDDGVIRDDVLTRLYRPQRRKPGMAGGI